jgi:hypothetical protein
MQPQIGTASHEGALAMLFTRAQLGWGAVGVPCGRHTAMNGGEGNRLEKQFP